MVKPIGKPKTKIELAPSKSSSATLAKASPLLAPKKPLLQKVELVKKATNKGEPKKSPRKAANVPAKKVNRSVKKAKTSDTEDDEHRDQVVAPALQGGEDDVKMEEDEESATQEEEEVEGVEEVEEEKKEPAATSRKPLKKPAQAKYGKVSTAYLVFVSADINAKTSKVKSGGAAARAPAKVHNLKGVKASKSKREVSAENKMENEDGDGEGEHEDLARPDTVSSCIVIIGFTTELQQDDDMIDGHGGEASDAGSPANPEAGGQGGETSRQMFARVSAAPSRVCQIADLCEVGDSGRTAKGTCFTRT